MQKHSYGARNALLALTTTALIFSPMPSISQSFLKTDGNKNDRDKPVAFEADNISYSSDQKFLNVKGNVKIEQAGSTLWADEVSYNNQTQWITADGNVKLDESSGNRFYASHAEMKDDFNQINISNARAELSDNSTMVANNITRTEPTVTEFNNVAYTPCVLCEDGKGKIPFWQIDAQKVTYDEGKQRIEYKNAYFKLFNQEVFYTPYFSHATPDADRKSGFLMPSYGSSSTLGLTLKTPYYVNIAPEMDATVTPFFTSREGPVMAGEFRRLTENGRFELLGSITNPKERDALGNETEGRRIRGHIEGFGKFTLEDSWEWGFSGKRSSDDTYLQRYQFGNEDLLTSRAYIQQIKDKDYFSAETITFQGLNVNDDPDQTPLILPLLNLHKERSANWYGSKFVTDANLLALTRGEGAESRRISATQGWVLPHITSGGHVLQFKTSLRGDAYHVDDVPSLTGGSDQSGLTGRIIPEAQLDWSLPLVQVKETYHSYIEPVVNLIISPNGGNPDKIPNEDSQETELSDVNIFSNNHFTGYDRVEGGPRMNYGFRGGIYTRQDIDVNFLLGQTYRVSTDDDFAPETGLDSNFSDYVGRVAVSYQDNLELSYRFRLDQKNLSLRRNEVQATANLQPFSLSVGYVLIDEDAPVDPSFNRQEVTLGVGYTVNKNWSLSGYTRRNLSENGSDNGGPINAGMGINYSNDCINIGVDLAREFTRDRDIEPSTSVLFRIGLKNLTN